MPIEFYSSKKDNSGAALFVSFDSKNQAFYGEFLKQNGWSSDTQNGIFKGGMRARVKFSLDEVCDIIQAIKERTKSSFYHKFEKDGKTEITSGTFGFYAMKDNTGKITREGFGFSIKKGDLQYKLGLSLGSAEKLAQYIQFGLTHIFSAIYAADKKRAIEFKEKQDSKTIDKETETQENKEGDIEEKGEEF